MSTRQVAGNGQGTEIVIYLPHIDEHGELLPVGQIATAVNGAVHVVAMMCEGQAILFVGEYEWPEDGDREVLTQVVGLTPRTLDWMDRGLLRTYGALTRDMLEYQRLAIYINGEKLHF